MTEKCWMAECFKAAEWQVSFKIQGGEIETDVKVCNRHKGDGAAEVANAMFASPALVDEIKHSLEPYGLEFPTRGQVTMAFYPLKPAAVATA